MKTAAWNRKHGRSTVLEKEMFLDYIWMSPEMISCRWTEDRKGAGNKSGESGARYLEAESIKSRTESTGGCVKFKTVTEVRQSSACDIFTTAGIYLVLNFLLDWEPVEKFKERCDVVSFTFFHYELSSTVMWWRLWTEEAGKSERRELQQSRHDRMSEVTSFTVASVERYFQTD